MFRKRNHGIRKETQEAKERTTFHIPFNSFSYTAFLWIARLLGLQQGGVMVLYLYKLEQSHIVCLHLLSWRNMKTILWLISTTFTTIAEIDSFDF